MKYLMLPRLYDRSCYLPILIINNDWYKAVVDLESQITNMSQFLRIVFFLALLTLKLFCGRFIIDH